MLTLIKGGQVYTPEKIGGMDLLLGGSQILAIGPDLKAAGGIATEVVDATGKFVVPGYIDSHMHLLGGGGGSGPDSRTHEIDVSTLSKGGITTVVGTLGINTVSFGLKDLLMAANALDLQGISTLMYTGGYQLPAVTITDSVLTDLSLLPKVVGVKIALFDVLGSHPSKETFKELASKVCLGGRLGGKMGLIHAHLGDTEGNSAELADLLKFMGMPPEMLVTTHVNRTAKVLEMSVEGGLAGVSMDITALYTPDNELPETIAPAKALRRLLDANVPLDSITMSSDGNAVQPIRNEKGEVTRLMLTPANAIATEVAKAVLRDSVALQDMLRLVTINAARRLSVERYKGSLEVGKHADVLLLDKNLEVDTVYARGVLMLKDKKPTVIGHFEKDYAKISV